MIGVALAVGSRVRSIVPLLALLAACTQPSGDDGGPAVASHVESFDWPGVPTSTMDVVVVIDDSPEMAPYLDRTQAMLRSLDTVWPVTPPSLTPDLHIAVTTADPMDAGVLRGASTVLGTFLVDEHTPDGSRRGNHQGSIGDAVAALASVGTNGTAGAPLANAHAALEAQGFFRTDAYLAIVIVTAHDDASTMAIDEVVAATKSLKADPSEVVVALVAPADAPRLNAFAAAFPNRSSQLSIDTADYAAAVAILGQLVKIDLGAPCIDEPLDVDPETPGAQYDCSIESVQEDGVVQIVPPCPGIGSAGPSCWQYVADPQICSVDAAGRIELPPFRWWFPTRVRGQCVVAN